MNSGKGTTAHIAILLSKFNVAGIQRMRLNLARRFLDAGHSVDLVVGNADGLIGELVPTGVRVIEVAHRYPLLYFPGLLRYLRRQRPSHLLSSYEDITTMALLANWMLGSRTFVLSSTHNALSRVRKEGGWLNRLKYRLILRLMGPLYRRAGAVVAVSRGLADEVAELAGMDRATVKVIYNPVISEEFEGLRSSEPPSWMRELGARRVIGFFGRLHAQKRVDILLKAFARLDASHDCTLLIVGEGPEEASLRKIVCELGIQRSVVFQGFVKNPLPVMAACHAVVLSSDYEGLGNVLVEAMACGTQVISTNCPFGPSEILEEGRLGQLVDVGDVAGLAEAMRRLLEREFWVPPEALRAGAERFTAAGAGDRYLEALGLGG
jgi:glycosyltransferase involved in cell wall biosynthesis